jgi:Ca-activated chloride channel family protein
MLAQDVRPNRLQRSKLAVNDLVKNIQGDRLGLIAFAGSAFLQCPLTVDYNGFLLSLNAVDTQTIPRGGTAIASAIREAVRSYQGGQKKYKVLIIITDGEDHEGDALAAALEAKKEGIVIFCIGIGTREGELLPARDETTGSQEFLKDRQGNVIKSRLDETVLQKIALQTGGVYVRSTNTEFGLDLLYRERLSKMEKRELLGKMNKHYDERFQVFLGLAIILLLAEMFISDRK